MATKHLYIHLEMTRHKHILILETKSCIRSLKVSPGCSTPILEGRQALCNNASSLKHHQYAGQATVPGTSMQQLMQLIPGI